MCNGILRLNDDTGKASVKFSARRVRYGASRNGLKTWPSIKRSMDMSLNRPLFHDVSRRDDERDHRLSISKARASAAEQDEETRPTGATASRATEEEKAMKALRWIWRELFWAYYLPRDFEEWLKKRGKR